MLHFATHGIHEVLVLCQERHVVVTLDPTHGFVSRKPCQHLFEAARARKKKRISAKIVRVCGCLCGV